MINFLPPDVLSSFLAAQLAQEHADACANVWERARQIEDDIELAALLAREAKHLPEQTRALSQEDLEWWLLFAGQSPPLRAGPAIRALRMEEARRKRVFWVRTSNLGSPTGQPAPWEVGTRLTVVKTQHIVGLHHQSRVLREGTQCRVLGQAVRSHAGMPAAGALAAYLAKLAVGTADAYLVEIKES